MKIAVCSDLHLEFGTISLENTENADVLILSGDICVEKDLLERSINENEYNDKSSKIHKFFEECCARFPATIYIAGNHEHYHGDYGHTIANLRSRLGYLANLHILDKQVIKIGDVTFIGGTLWTDMNKEDSKTLSRIKSYMNDYRIIQNSNEVVHFKDEDGKFHTRTAKFSPEDSVKDHKAMLEFIKTTVANNPTMPVVVVGHHSPSKQSTKPQYEKDVLVNGAYSSDLTEFILNHPQIKVWTHGHTHHEFDYMVGSTRIVCNPRGYIGYEYEADNFKLKFVDV
jgi:hypothetical protein